MACRMTLDLAIPVPKPQGTGTMTLEQGHKTHKGQVSTTIGYSAFKKDPYITVTQPEGVSTLIMLKNPRTKVCVWNKHVEGNNSTLKIPVELALAVSSHGVIHFEAHVIT